MPGRDVSEAQTRLPLESCRVHVSVDVINTLIHCCESLSCCDSTEAETRFGIKNNTFIGTNLKNPALVWCICVSPAGTVVEASGGAENSH